MSEFFDRTGPLQEAGSYPQWAQQLIVDCQASKDRVSGHELYRRMRDAELSPALMRLPRAARRASTTRIRNTEVAIHSNSMTVI